VSPRASAIAVAFIANGLGVPSFLPRLPGRQADLGLSDAALGGVLLGLAAGAVVASPLAGRAVGRFGSQPVVVGAAIALGTSLWTAGAAPHAAVLFLAFLLIGAADAALDIAMNANGAAYERGTGGSVMHRLHAAWSLGALTAGGLAAAAAAAGIPLTWQLVVVGAAFAVAVVATRSGLVGDDAAAGSRGAGAAPATGHGDLAFPTSTTAPDGRQNPDDDAAPGDLAFPTSTTAPDGRQNPDDDAARGDLASPTSTTAPDGRQNPEAPNPEAPGVGPDAGAGAGTADTAATGRRRLLRLPHSRAMLVLGLVTMAAAILEGGPYDWSAVRLERLGVGPAGAALGFAAFVVGMLAGRLVGDHLVDRFGRRATLRGGMLLVAAGLGAGSLADVPVVFALGLVVAGVGVSGMFPLVFSAGANTPGIAAGAGAATVSLAARLGFLIEPPLMGVLGETVGLRWAFLVVAGVALAVAVAAGRVVPEPASV
jgi:MFS family permease